MNKVSGEKSLSRELQHENLLTSKPRGDADRLFDNSSEIKTETPIDSGQYFLQSSAFKNSQKVEEQTKVEKQSKEVNSISIEQDYQIDDGDDLNHKASIKAITLLEDDGNQFEQIDQDFSEGGLKVVHSSFKQNHNKDFEQTLFRGRNILKKHSTKMFTESDVIHEEMEEATSCGQQTQKDLDLKSIVESETHISNSRFEKSISYQQNGSREGGALQKSITEHKKRSEKFTPKRFLIAIPSNRKEESRSSFH